MRKIITAACLLAAAQVAAQSPVDLDPVTVTNTRSPQKISETGRNITVIEGKLFQQLPVNSLDELLKYVPGVEVQSRGPMGAQSDIVLRGGTFQQVLVLLDGVKLNDPITGHFSSYIPVAPFEIERIEILRGPAAAIYGTEAVGGVINVITKTFNRFISEKKLNGTAGITAGQYQLINGQAGIYSTGKNMNAGVGVLTNNTSGQLLRGSNRGFVHNHTVSGSIAVALKNDWRLSARSSFDSRDFAAQNFYTTFKSDTATEKVTTWWNQVQLKQQKERSSNQVDIMYKATSDDYLYNSTAIANKNKSAYLVLQYLHTRKVGQALTANMGTQLDRRAITSNDRGNHATHHGAAFSSLLYNKNKWNLSPGLRLDWDENYGVALLPQLSASYRLKQVVLRANAGRAIRSGDFTERYNNYNKALVASGSIGNPDLNTENSWSYETGADLFIKSNFKASLTGFYRHQQNLIDFVTTPYADMPRKDNLVATGVYALARNIKRVNTRGIELDLTYQPTLTGNQQLFINGSISFLKSVSGDAVPSFYIISHAGTICQANVIYTIKKFSITANFIYKHRGMQSATSIDAVISRDYFVTNGKLAYTFFNQLKCFVAVNNIGDTRYSDLLGSIMPHRWTSCGISVDF